MFWVKFVKYQDFTEKNCFLNFRGGLLQSVPLNLQLEGKKDTYIYELQFVHGHLNGFIF